MYERLEKRLHALQQSGLSRLLGESRIGLEKESLRVSSEGTLAQTPHPAILGSALTHPNITTDYSEAMLEFVSTHHPSATTVHGDVADLPMADASLGVAFINACYSNIIDKHKTFTNLRRMLRNGGRLVISHPLGRSFVEVLKKNVPFPLDDFPAKKGEAAELFAPYGFRVSLFVDEPDLYILRLTADE